MKTRGQQKSNLIAMSQNNLAPVLLFVVMNMTSLVEGLSIERRGSYYILTTGHFIN